ncbi:SAV_6107 family HEPN domain-containing protein [Corynebacterium heidelbergense]|uniref:SAV-6107-like HEPN domain-containing protein n=1 Tax=Corynebacterium heidelbergense TaxID=2055947 RepID=A0A364V9N6_9CORY|nr:SAV_6107 family HEPN domain-containing protein [Corynebacterium heidelbergense]RAV33341.1 hypothetical protein CWC39_09000 [Corynebacterium heidelbergense]WCZ36359.1 hypothetical protein CHEID_04040 [Corynebacterium heidelbergense]
MATQQRRGWQTRPDARAFVAAAEDQLELARTAATAEVAIVYAYRAALRAAGSLIESERKGRKRLPAGSAWSRLRRVSPERADRAANFEAHARYVNRVDMGLEREVPSSVMDAVYRDASALIEEARLAAGLQPQTLGAAG